jgi:hypothetical protein
MIKQERYSDLVLGILQDKMVETKNSNYNLEQGFKVWFQGLLQAGIQARQAMNAPPIEEGGGGGGVPAPSPAIE